MTYLTPSTPVTSGVSTIGSTTQSARQTQPLERSETNPSHVTSQMQAPIRHLTSVDLAFAMTNDLAPVGRVDFLKILPTANSVIGYERSTLLLEMISYW